MGEDCVSERPKACIFEQLYAQFFLKNREGRSLQVRFFLFFRLALAHILSLRPYYNILLTTSTKYVLPLEYVILLLFFYRKRAQSNARTQSSQEIFCLLIVVLFIISISIGSNLECVCKRVVRFGWSNAVEGWRCEAVLTFNYNNSFSQ